MLSKKEISEIQELQQVCEQKESIHLKLNWDMLTADNRMEDENFFFYENDQLVGFLATYSFGNKVEICGMVHPAYRNKGIFTNLLKDLKSKIQSNKTVYLNAPAHSISAQNWLSNKNLPLAFSERQMRYHPIISSSSHPNASVTLREASIEDKQHIIDLDIKCFDFNEEEASSFYSQLESEKDSIMYVIESEGMKIGKVRLSYTSIDQQWWIYGFAILPAHQGKGYGKLCLEQIIHNYSQKGPLFLEVDGLNPKAEALYKRVGFESFNVQNYYRI
ncbi:putative acetyltransferase [Bacillus sp. TS-2]|nr:putative acetyltransferase [Bacillus sp. TS-2]